MNRPCPALRCRSDACPSRRARSFRCSPGPQRKNREVTASPIRTNETCSIGAGPPPSTLSNLSRNIPPTVWKGWVREIFRTKMRSLARANRWVVIRSSVTSISTKSLLIRLAPTWKSRCLSQKQNCVCLALRRRTSLSLWLLLTNSKRNRRNCLS